MQFLKVTQNMTRKDLAMLVGENNVDRVLALNGLVEGNGYTFRGKPIQNVYEAYRQKMNDVLSSNSGVTISAQKKKNMLDYLTQDSDAYINLSQGTEQDWTIYSATGTLNGYLRLPEDIRLPASDTVIGNNLPISEYSFKLTTKDILEGRTVNPNNFAEVSSVNPSVVGYTVKTGSHNNTNLPWNLPWGKIQIYSYMDNEIIDIPAYPENYQDGRKANYTTMSNLLYQYEPWYVYESSGDRQNTFKFKLHRDMWSGDHRDGQANKLIRFCESLCYPEYRGSTVNVPKVALLIDGQMVISGIMQNVQVDWEQPIGLDNWYLVFNLTFTIIEISNFPLNHGVVKNLGLIG